MAIALTSLDLEALLSSIEDLDIKLTQEQRATFVKYCQTFINTDPQHALEKILAELERITQRKVEIKKAEERIKKDQDRRKWEKLLTKDKEEQKPVLAKAKKQLFEKEQEKQIFDAAATRINIKLNEKQYDEISDIFNEHINDETSPVTKANAALLGVISVAIAGGVRIVVQYSWGNLINYPDLNPYHGTAPIDAAAKIDTSFAGGDPQGTELRAVLNVLSSGVINPSLAQFLKIDANPSAKQDETQEDRGPGKGPAPKPYKSPTSIDPFRDD